MIKIINIVALLIVPVVASLHGGKADAGKVAMKAAAPVAAVTAAAVPAASVAAVTPPASAVVVTGAPVVAAPAAVTTDAGSYTVTSKIDGEKSAGLMKVYFASASSALPAGADKGVTELVAAFKAKANGKLALSGYVDPSGDAVKNAELAKLRAFAVRDALKAAGVAEDKIEMVKPVDLTVGATSAAEGRRVEVSLQ